MKQEHPTNYKYHSTQQFRNVVRSIKEQATFVGLDEDGSPVFDKTKPTPKLEYIGTTKLHGTNASIILHEDGVISFHSKNNLLGYVTGEEFTLLSDNSEFAQSMYRRIDSVKEVLENAIEIVKSNYGSDIRPLKVSGEWCGQGIQKGVAVAELDKAWYLFGVKVSEIGTDNTDFYYPYYTTYYYRFQ